MAPNFFALNGVHLNGEAAIRLQGNFCKHFTSRDGSARINPPYWSEAFKSARRIQIDDLDEKSLPPGKHVFCIINRINPNHKNKRARDVMVCTIKDFNDAISNIHWSVKSDFYLFDNSYKWFIACTEELIHQKPDHGSLTVMYFTK